MSAFLVSNESLNAITQAFCQILKSKSRDPKQELALIAEKLMLDNGMNYDDAKQRGLDFISSFPASMTPQDIVLQCLLFENCSSLKARYGEDTDMGDPSKHYKYQDQKDVSDWLEANLYGNFQGIINCYVYQSDNHEQWEQSVANLIIEKLKELLFARMCEVSSSISNTEAWDWKPSKKSERGAVAVAVKEPFDVVNHLNACWGLEA